MQLDLIGGSIIERAQQLFAEIENQPLESKIETINLLRVMLHKISPFATEPVDCVQWIRLESVKANDYNPNSVAPPEMRLLEHSIHEDGYTQPIVAWKNCDHYEVVDGFHRNRVARESPAVRSRIKGYIPLSIINAERQDRGDRIAATIRHNRARGKHQVEAMSDIVVELKRRNWTDERIARELGMDQDEILRLCQITGLADVFSDQEFSKSWTVEGAITENDFEELTDDLEELEAEVQVRTVNTNDETRIFHTYDKWECYKAGFYASSKEGTTRMECEEAYRKFLSDLPAFADALDHVIHEWKHSCEHYLTNRAMNRIAWLGQAAACYALGIPAVYRSGFYLLSEEEQRLANETALTALNTWLKDNGRDPVTMEEAYSYDRQMEIY